MYVSLLTIPDVRVHTKLASLDRMTGERKRLTKSHTLTFARTESTEPLINHLIQVKLRY